MGAEDAGAASAPGLAQALAAAEIEIRHHDAAPLFNEAAVAAALLTPDGKTVIASSVFQAIGAAAQVDTGAVSAAARGAKPSYLLVERQDGDTAIFAYATAAQTQTWRLPPDVRRAARRRPSDVVVVTTHVLTQREPLEDACRSFGLSGLQTRVVAATMRVGSVKAAAAEAGVSYQTAREAMAGALKRTGSPRQAALVSAIASVAFGVLPGTGGLEIVADLWGLTPRQAAICALVAGGLSRGEAARALRVSEAAVKKELDRIFLALQVGSAAALARKIAEANAMQWLTRATGGDLGYESGGAEPLRLIARSAGGRIAVSDYGPASAPPVLVAHSSLTTRHVARPLVSALQAAGFRPIAIDRPGYGLSDEVPGAALGRHDPFATAAEDALQVLDALRIRTIDVVARGAAQFVVALGARAGQRLGRVVLINPDPHHAASSARLGVYGALKDAALRNPAIIELWWRLASRQISYDVVAAFLQRSAKGSPADEAAARRPEIVRDYFRAQRTFGTGRIAGVVNEQTALAKGDQPAPLDGCANWRVLVGEEDTLHDPAQALVYWREVLPDASFELVPGAGRLLALSHPELVVRALTEHRKAGRPMIPRRGG